MKPTYFTGIALGIILCIAITGFASADSPVSETPETQLIQTSTSLNVHGIMTTIVGLTWQLRSEAGISGTGEIGAPLENGGWPTSYPDGDGADISGWTVDPFIIDLLGPAPVGDVQYTTAYDTNIVAQAGQSVLIKSMDIDTRNKVISQSNLNTKTLLTYIATDDGGNVVGSENLMLDGTGAMTVTAEKVLCPFAAAQNPFIPPFCNIVQAGSKYDLTVGSVTTNANDRFVETDATNPVLLNYDISVKPYGTTQGQILASGSTMAYSKAHIQEGRVFNITPAGDDILWTAYVPGKSEDLVYDEQSSAQGTITLFNKVIAYQSGMLLV